MHTIRSAHHLMGLIIACCASWQQWHVSLFSYKLQQFASLCVDIIQTCRQQFQLRNLCSILYYRCKDVVIFMLQYSWRLKLKPKMMTEAIKNAEQTAQQFTDNSSSRLNKIVSADHGQFSIENRDENTPYIKKVRVVTTVTYSLKD